MKKCSCCGEQNAPDALHCTFCGKPLSPDELGEPSLEDPTGTLRVVATFGDVTEASLVRDRLQQAGIEACIPEELDPSPFGSFRPLANVTVRVAEKDYEAAKTLLEAAS
jgi:hypothetical protein